MNFYKNVLEQTWKVFNTRFGPQWKDWESSYKARQILVLFSKWVAVILDYSYINDFRVTKIFKQIKLERVWGKLEAKSCFRRRPFTRWNSALREKLNFWRFLLVLTEFSFREEDWALYNYTMKFWDFSAIS